MATFASIDLTQRATEEDEKDDTEMPSSSASGKTVGIAKTGPKRLMTNEVSSIFNLKNELLKRKDTISKTKLDYTHIAGKSSVLTTKKEEKETLKQEAAERNKRISANEKAWKQEEEERFQLAQQKMRDKSALYERLAAGSIILENTDNTPIDFMVDFGSKKRQKEEERERRSQEDAADSGPSNLGRAPIPEHYHHSEEQRVFGVSHMRLSSNEDKRKEEIQDLLDMSKKTIELRKKEQTSKEIQDKKRLQKVNALRLRKGLPPLKEPTPPPKAEDVNLDDIPMPVVHETPEERHIRLMKSDREWDRGKGLYTTWIEKQREDRDDDFRPPDSYFK